MKTIDVMKQLISAAKEEPHATPRLVNAVRSAESHVEEAQTVEPVFWVAPHGTGFRVHMGSKKPDYAQLWEPLFTRPTPAPSGERETLISAMRMYKAAYPDSEHFGKVADMLAADAQRYDELFAEYHEVCTEVARVKRDAEEVKSLRVLLNYEYSKPVQQVAVPQGCVLVPIEPTNEMVQACDAKFVPRIALPFFVAAYKTMLAAAPQAAPRVPMTDMEIYTALASIAEDPEPASEIIGCDDWPEIVDMIRRIEAHHGIKP